jgi:BirA family biotin operon repressor/biotin-[acetyl-CoA-carboxylase] ligase
LSSEAIGHVHYGDIDSTNRQARRFAEKNLTGPLWITAATQTQGRGRRDRPWVSSKGNLFATLLITFPVTPIIATQVGFVTALAICDTASQFLSPLDAPKLKWPNDVLLHGEKLSGILSETLPSRQADSTCLAIGCGINITTAPDDTAYGATFLNQYATSPTNANQVFATLKHNMQKWLEVWDNGKGFEQIVDSWHKKAGFLRKAITITSPDRTESGIFIGLAKGGELILQRADGTKKLFAAGDVSLRSGSL